MSSDSTELYYSHMEADRNEAEHAYFRVREADDTAQARRTFRAGFERAYQKLWPLAGAPAPVQTTPEPTIGPRYCDCTSFCMRVSKNIDPRLCKAARAGMETSPVQAVCDRAAHLADVPTPLETGALCPHGKPVDDTEHQCRKCGPVESG